MDTKLLLVKMISLLYCESLATKVQRRSTDLAATVLQHIKTPEHVTETDQSRATIIGLRETLAWMMDQGNETYDHNALLQRVRMNANDDYSVFQAFEETEHYQEMGPDDILQAASSLYKEIKYALDQMDIRDLVHKYHRKIFYGRENIDYRELITSLIADLEPYAQNWTDDQQAFVLNLVNTSDPGSLADILEKGKDDFEGIGGLKSGWQANNRMLGESGQFRRGMFVLVGGLTHMYKSGYCHDLFRHFSIHNDPEPDDPEKKPTLLYFSTENRAEEDVLRMYTALKENETGEAVDVSQIDTQEAGEYISRRLTERGWTSDMLRIDPDQFSYYDLINVVLEYESKGHEIHGIVFDYLALINKAGCQSSMIGEDIRQLMQKVRTFMSARNILFITPHQLSQEAMSLKRSGVQNFVAEIAGKNYWDSSKRIANEADLEVFVDIVQQNNHSYLAVHRGKHRTVKNTPVADRHFFLPFSDVGYVPDDLHGEDRSLKHLTSAEAGMSLDWN